MASIPTPSLVAQAAAILEAATSLQRQLEQHGLQQPSFEAGGRKDWHDAIEHPEVLRARSALIDASNLMLNMALGPMDILSSLVGPAVSKVDVFRTLDALGVSEAVPLDTPISIDDLAARVGANPRLLRQQLRFAYLMGIFYEPREGYVAHTSISAAIPSLSAWTRMRLGYLMSSGAWRIPEALRIWQDSPPPGHVQVPVSLADSKGRDFWSALQEEDPENRGMEKFSSAMKALFASHSGNSLGPFVTGFDWAGLGDGLVVDVGGGNGHIEVSILNAVPSGLNFVIQDQETNRGLAIENIRQHGAADRIQFQVHDFFHPQPPHLRPKAYLLSRILHDWQDGDCVRILRNLVPGMEEHAAQLFVMERVLPDRSGDIPNHMEQLIRTQDLLMFTLFGGGERSLRQWEALFEKADPRLKITGIRHSPLSPFSSMHITLMKEGDVKVRGRL